MEKASTFKNTLYHQLRYIFLNKKNNQKIEWHIYKNKRFENILIKQ